MFAVGHLAIGYLTGKAASKLLNTELNISLVFLLSILPDADLVLGRFVPWVQHRGLTHSIILYAAVSVPVFLVFGRQSVPSLVAMVQHSILGDFLTGGGVQLMWPATSRWYGVQLPIFSLLSLSLEWITFLTAIVILFGTTDVRSLLQHHPTNLLLTVPAVTIILPAFASFPLAMPVELMIPHFVLLTLLAVSIAADFGHVLKKFANEIRA